MLTISNSDFAKSIAADVNSSVTSNLLGIVMVLAAKERYVTKREYGRLYGVSDRTLSSKAEYLRSHNALIGEHKMQRYDKFFVFHTGKMIWDNFAKGSEC